MGLRNHLVQLCHFTSEGPEMKRDSLVCLVIQRGSQREDWEKRKKGNLCKLEKEDLKAVFKKLFEREIPSADSFPQAQNSQSYWVRSETGSSFRSPRYLCLVPAMVCISRKHEPGIGLRYSSVGNRTLKQTLKKLEQGPVPSKFSIWKIQEELFFLRNSGSTNSYGQ